MTDTDLAPTPLPPLSDLSPEGYEQTVFMPPPLPTGLFMLVDQEPPDEGWQDGPYDPQDLNTDPDTNIMYSSNGDGHPVYLRVLEQTGNLVTLVDGGGDIHKWLIRPIPDSPLTVSDPFTPDEQVQLYNQAQQETQNG